MEKILNFEQNEKLRKLLLENPDLPLVVFAGQNAFWYDYTSTLCTDVRAYIGEFLNCEQKIDEEHVFEDRIEFKEAVEDFYSDFEGTDAEFDEFINQKLEEYEPYWTKCITLYVDN